MLDATDNRGFNPELAATHYRRVIAQLNSATTEIEKHEFRTIAMRLRIQWKAWSGEDDLHECALGE
jgi:hypothetical protein